MALVKTEDLVRSRKSSNTLDKAGKKECMTFNLYSKYIWMIIMVRGKYTAMMTMFRFMMMMMMDALLVKL